jgi:long-chain acyl-CoA synthetase
VVCGRGGDFVTALLFCNQGALEKWAGKKGIAFSSFDGLLKTPEVRALLQDDVQKINQVLEVKYYRIRCFYLAPHAPTLERGELTPTAKICRGKVLENYAAEVEAMRGLEERDDIPGVIRVP